MLTFLHASSSCLVFTQLDEDSESAAIDDDDGGTDHYIYKSQALAANATFEHTSKIVLNAGDMLGFITGGAADVDVVVNYLEQTL